MLIERDHRTQSAISFSPSRSWSAILIGLAYGPVGATGTSRVAKQLPACLGVGGKTMKTLMIGLGTVVLTRPALAQRCLSFRAPAFFAGAAVAPGYPYPAYGDPGYYPYPLPPAPSLGFGRGRHLRARVRRARREDHQLYVPRPR